MRPTTIVALVEAALLALVVLILYAWIKGGGANKWAGDLLKGLAGGDGLPPAQPAPFHTDPATGSPTDNQGNKVFGPPPPGGWGGPAGQGSLPGNPGPNPYEPPEGNAVPAPWWRIFWPW